MLNIAKKQNLEIHKNEQRKTKLHNRLTQRRQYLSQIKQQEFNKYSSQIFVDPVSFYLYLTLRYWQRIEKRSVKTMSFDLSRSTFFDVDSPLLDEMFEKVIQQFAKHKIKMSVKTSEANGQIYRWKISLKTLELF
jgi:hypothetical protein